MKEQRLNVIDGQSRNTTDGCPARDRNDRSRGSRQEQGQQAGAGRQKAEGR